MLLISKAAAKVLMDVMSAVSLSLVPPFAALAGTKAQFFQMIKKDWNEQKYA
jgi:hypothetical protein